MNCLFGAEFPLVAQIIPQVCVTWVQLIQHGDSGRLNVNPLGLRNPRLSLEDFLWAIGEDRIASPERVASQGEATILALPLKASLALLRGVLPVSEAVSTQ